MMSLEDVQTAMKYEKEDQTTSDSCEDTYSGHLMHFVIESLQVPSEEQYLEIAVRSLPKGISIRPTSVLGGHYGIWSDSIIPKGIKFGPYDAAAIQLNVSQQDAYTSTNGVGCSWFRYVNCAPSKDQMNLITIESGQKIYYCTSRQISCDEELLSWNNDNSVETGIIKKEIEITDINNEERDTKIPSSCDEAISFEMSSTETSVYYPSDKGTRDSVWSRDAVRLLIKQYKELDLNQFCRLKDKWRAISIALQQNGYHLSAEDCDQKWRNLKRTYRMVKYNREHTRKGRLTWEYFDIMKDVLQLDPCNNFFPNCVSQNRTDTSSSKMQHLTNEAALSFSDHNSQKSPDMPIDSVTSASISKQSNEHKKPAKKIWNKKTYSAPPLWFKKLEEERKEEKKQLFEMLDKMHSDMVKVMEKRNNILQKLVKMLESHKSDSKENLNSFV